MPPSPRSLITVDVESDRTKHQYKHSEGETEDTAVSIDRFFRTCERGDGADLKVCVAKL